MKGLVSPLGRFGFILLLAGAGTVISLLAQNSSDRVRVFVEFDPYTPQAAVMVRAAGGTVHYDFPRLHAVAATLPKAAIQGLLRNPNVVAIEDDPARMPYAQTTPYGIGMVQADQVSDASAGNRKICIIDSGYYQSHEDLADNHVAGSNDSGTGNWWQDGCGHGTHVAGTIAAVDNSLGVLGVLPHHNINLHIVKVFGDSCTWTYSSSLIAALDQCTANGANVVSMSLGGTVKSRFEDIAFRQAYSNGVLSVAAAGNGGNTQKSYPASYDSVVSVAAIDQNKLVASFSQKNDQVELAAPGVGVLSTVPWLDTDTLTVGPTTYNGNYIENAARGTASGPLADGGLCTSTASWSGKVVLCSRGTNSFYEKVTNVQNGGGTAAVIYNNAPGNFLGTLGAGNSSNIPAISLSQADGQDAMTKVGASGTVVSTIAKPASGYEAWDGTSMAAPHVSGVAASVWSNHNSCTNVEVRTALQSTAEDLGAAGRDTAYGYGLVQAKAADDLLATSCGGGGGSCTLGQPGDLCVSNDQCCSNNCKGKPGAKTCK